MSRWNSSTHHLLILIMICPGTGDGAPAHAPAAAGWLAEDSGLIDRHSLKRAWRICGASQASVVLGTAGKALLALRHLLGPAVTPTKGVSRPLEHFRALPAHGPRNAG